MPINTKGNTNSTIKAEITNPLPFCTLTLLKHQRHITKHYTNLSYILPQKHYQLLSFLTYLCKPDNSFIYDTHLFNQYKSAILYAQEYYTCENPLFGNNVPKTGRTLVNIRHTSPISQPTFRKIIKSFIESSIIVPINKSLLLVNPMLSYHSFIYSPDAYDTFQTNYNTAFLSQDQANQIRRVISSYYFDSLLTNSVVQSNQSKKAKSIRAEVSKSTIPKHQDNNNTKHNTPYRYPVTGIIQTNNKPSINHTSITTFQNIPLYD